MGSRSEWLGEVSGLGAVDQRGCDGPDDGPGLENDLVGKIAHHLLQRQLVSEQCLRVTKHCLQINRWLG